MSTLPLRPLSLSNPLASIRITLLALGWVKYCNGTKDTCYANLRQKTGHAEPYNVSTWESTNVQILDWALGNKMWKKWRVNQMTPNNALNKPYHGRKIREIANSRR